MCTNCALNTKLFLNKKSYKSLERIHNEKKQKIILQQCQKINRTIDIISLGDNQWRFKYGHYQRLSNVVDSGHYGLILDKIKITQSLAITNECIGKLVRSSGVDDQLFNAVYQLKQWMFNDENLLFYAVESGSLERVKLLVNQEYPVVLNRLPTSKIKMNIQTYAWCQLKFEIFDYLLSDQVKHHQDGGELADISPKLKAECLLRSIGSLKDLSIFQTIWESEEGSTLYNIKKELMLANQFQYPKQLIQKKNGISIAKMMFPNYKPNLDHLDVYLFNSSSLDNREYQLEVMNYVAKNHRGMENGLPFDKLKLEVKQSLVSAYEKLCLDGYQIDRSELDNLEKFEYLMLICKCIGLLEKGYASIQNSPLYWFRLNLYKHCGLIGLIFILSISVSKMTLLNELFTHGTLEQVRLARKVWVSIGGRHMVFDWCKASFDNPDPSVFKYLISLYGMEYLVKLFQHQYSSISPDTTDRLELCLAIDPGLSFVRCVERFELQSITPEYIDQLIILWKKEIHTPAITSMIHLWQGCYMNNDIYSFVKLLEIRDDVECENFHYLQRLLIASIRSQKYQFIIAILKNHISLLENVIDEVGICGDIRVIETVIECSPNGKLQNNQLNTLAHYLFQSGHFEAIDYLRATFPEKELNWSGFVVSTIFLGRLDVVKYYIDNFADDISLPLILSQSIVCGQLDTFKYLIEYSNNTDHDTTYLLQTFFNEPNLRSILNSSSAALILRYAVSLGAKIEINEKILQIVQKKSIQTIRFFKEYQEQQQQQQQQQIE
ncbi:hypothetical protein PPL_05477 [Heterostelium album PN500]|uniref:Uncharacterized protein n=1 Tax=Heterostelium pallidum (strain ATCC 26659 / Pp 5 / PN500) TaxID=670386 RepID=D3BAA2_HETP5|nr:hypothetical protein PPL_05477 [Heterostelium album PN500]EFA81489.1 hypothetical protein PPL_05477 [Heterostelium album PN500]|eukprot:XP_020433607.1 hypothetical protein PPL_05477 [Heterostelium album PN500]